MGNKSSKSVQITTEAGKETVAEGAGKLEKIEDVDHKPKVNGDTEHSQEQNAEGVSSRLVWFFFELACYFFL